MLADDLINCALIKERVTLIYHHYMGTLYTQELCNTVDTRILSQRARASDVTERARSARLARLHRASTGHQLKAALELSDLCAHNILKQF